MSVSPSDNSLAIVAAVDEGGVIGHRGKIPWDIPEDRAWFQELTWGGALVMGKTTAHSIGRSLPGRRTFVVDERQNLDQAIAAARRTRRPVFIVGGASVYAQTLPLADTLYISRIAGHHEGDAFFPTINQDQWQIAQTRQFSGFRLEIYQRRRTSQAV